MRTQTFKNKRVFLAAVILWHCPVAVPWCHNNLSYAEQGSMNLTCLSASVALFHRQNAGQGTTVEKGPTNPWLHNTPSIFLKLLNGHEKRHKKTGLQIQHFSSGNWVNSFLFLRHIWACLPQTCICTLSYLKWEKEHWFKAQSFI